MPHRLRAGDTDEHVVEQRAENQSKRAKVDKFLADYGRLLLTAMLALSTWFMSHVVGPLREIPGLVAAQAHADTTARVRVAKTDSMFAVVNYKLDQGAVDRSRMVDILAVLAGLQCDQFTTREKRMSKLCGKLLNGELP